LGKQLHHHLHLRLASQRFVGVVHLLAYPQPKSMHIWIEEILVLKDRPNPLDVRIDVHEFHQEPGYLEKRDNKRDIHDEEM
jgi:hypothetical protein